MKLTEKQAQDFANLIIATNSDEEIKKYHRYLRLSITYGINDNTDIVRRIKALISHHYVSSADEEDLNRIDLNIILEPLGLYKDQNTASSNNVKIIENYIFKTYHVMKWAYDLTLKQDEIRALNPHILSFFKKYKGNIISSLSKFYLTNLYSIDGFKDFKNDLYMDKINIQRIKSLITYATTNESLLPFINNINTLEKEYCTEYGLTLKITNEFDLFNYQDEKIKHIVYSIVEELMDMSYSQNTEHLVVNFINTLYKENLLKGFIDILGTVLPNKMFTFDVAVKSKNKIPKEEIKNFSVDGKFKNGSDIFKVYTQRKKFESVAFPSPYVLSKLYEESSILEYIESFDNVKDIWDLFSLDNIKYLMSIDYKYDKIKSKLGKNHKETIYNQRTCYWTPFTREYLDFFGKDYNDIVENEVFFNGYFCIFTFLKSLNVSKSVSKDKEKIIKEAGYVLKKAKICLSYKSMIRNIDFRYIKIILKHFKYETKSLKNMFINVVFNIEK